MAHLPSTDIVTQAWLKTLSALTSAGVSTTLPGDSASWAGTGFVQAATVGGTPGSHFPLRSPVVAIDCWANTPNSAKPPWGKAAHLAEVIVGATYDFGQAEPVLPGDFIPVRILSVYPLSEPRKVFGDPAGFAHISFDLSINWVRLS